MKQPRRPYRSACLPIHFHWCAWRQRVLRSSDVFGRWNDDGRRRTHGSGQKKRESRKKTSNILIGVPSRDVWGPCANRSHPVFLEAWHTPVQITLSELQASESFSYLIHLLTLSISVRCPRALLISGCTVHTQTVFLICASSKIEAHGSSTGRHRQCRR